MADKEKNPAPDKEKPPPQDKEKPSSAEKAAAPEPAAPAGSGMTPLIAAIAAVVLAPALSWAVVQFVLLPRLEHKLATAPAAGSAAPAAGTPPAPVGGKEAQGKAVPPTYEFDNVVVNLAGTMGTRYLKASFMVTGSDPALHAVFEDKKALLTDVTLNVLSSLTLSDLEEPGSKNVLREKLVAAYNQALGRKLAEQVYFSDFVVQ